jgi:uncharacterized protein (DUF1501 family)
MDRRAFVLRSLALGCSAAASPLVTPVTFAATPGDHRLVVILLRGGMDGLGVVAPYGDPNFAALRGNPVLDDDQGMADLDGFYAAHAALKPLAPLWARGDLGFVHAVSTPYRDKSSHFDGQDLLEAGVNDLSSGLARDGWLNRMLQHMPGHGTDTAYAVGNDPLILLNGSAPVSRWSPDADLALSPQTLRLAEMVMAEDPAMARALAEAFQLASDDGDPVAINGGAAQMMSMMEDDMRAARAPGAEGRIAEFVAKRMREDARVAAFSLNGWDTHAKQAKTLPTALNRLASTLLRLETEMGRKVWGKTAVIAMTEFGRTALLNGTQGTDHGTGGAMILAGGAIRGGRVFGDWPGLAEADLYERRDLMPTSDVRAHAGWIIHGLFGIPRSTIERDIFPGMGMGSDPGLLL